MRMTKGEVIVLNYYPNDNKQDEVYDIVLKEQNMLLHIDNGKGIFTVTEDISQEVIDGFQECYEYYGCWFHGDMINRYLSEKPNVIEGNDGYLLSLTELGEGLTISFEYKRGCFTLSLCDDEYVLVKVY